MDSGHATECEPETEIRECSRDQRGSTHHSWGVVRGWRPKQEDHGESNEGGAEKRERHGEAARVGGFDNTCVAGRVGQVKGCTVCPRCRARDGEQGGSRDVR